VSKDITHTTKGQLLLFHNFHNMNESDHPVVQNRGQIMHPHLPYTDAPHKRIYTVFQKNWTTKLMVVTLSNLNRFSKFFHC